ncbi:MAG TPA: hypothetical protein PKY39_04010 [Clostridiales bacterium]|nr:hypothetical protein [Clostridiales bacterium]
MKRSLIAVSMAIALLIGIVCGGAMVGYAGKAMFGDIDGNGKVTPADARLILRAAAKLEDLKEPTVNNASAADTLLYNDNGLKITYKLLIHNERANTKTLYFLIENSTNKLICVRMKGFTVNKKYVISPTFGGFVYDRETVLKSLTLSDNDLKDYDVKKINTITFKFELSDIYLKPFAASDEITITLP